MNREKKRTLLLIILLAAALVGSMIMIGVLLTERNASEDRPGGSNVPVYNVNGESVDEKDVRKNDGTISAPGYESLKLKADTASQGFALYNPAENSCYMKISIRLADGTVLWTSEPIAPGDPTDEIVLNPVLAAGSYKEAVLNYACFRDEACTRELNTAVIKLTLLVQ